MTTINGQQPAFVSMPTINGQQPFALPDLIPDGWNAVWQSAKQDSVSTPAWAAFVGDSTMYGANTTNNLAKPWPALLESYLLGTYSRYGEYYPTSFSANAAAAIGDTFNGTPPWTLTLNGASRSWGVLGIGSEVQLTGGTPVLVFVSPISGTQVDVLHFENFAGTWQFTVDGANESSVAAAIGAGSISQSYLAGVLTVTVTNTLAVGLTRRISVTGLDDAIHTVTCSTQSANNVMQVNGAAVVSASAGLGFVFDAFTGKSLSGFFGSNGYGGFAWQGKYDGAHLTGMGWPSQPNLFCLQHGINDCAIGRTIQQFTDDLQRAITAIRTGRADASILIIGACNPGADSDVNPGSRFNNYANWSSFLQAMYDLSLLNDCAFINIHRRWGNNPAAQGFVSTTNAHPTDAGHADILTAVQVIL